MIAYDITLITADEFLAITDPIEIAHKALTESNHKFGHTYSIGNALVVDCNYELRESVDRPGEIAVHRVVPVTRYRSKAETRPFAIIEDPTDTAYYLAALMAESTVRPGKKDPTPIATDRRERIDGGTVVHCKRTAR